MYNDLLVLNKKLRNTHDSLTSQYQYVLYVRSTRTVDMYLSFYFTFCTSFGRISGMTVLMSPPPMKIPSFNPVKVKSLIIDALQNVFRSSANFFDLWLLS